MAAAILFDSTVSSGAPISSQPSTGSRMDAHAEVAAVLYAASATQAALAKSVDAKLKSQQGRIEALAAQIKAGDTQHRAEMVAAQEAFVAQLADKDREFAVQINLFRNTVTDIASTPEGIAALDRFNAGDEIGAISILDKMRATNEKMRETTARLADAAEARRIARLTLEARSRGKLTTEAVIARFEEVVRLDPGVGDDWLQLDRLYQDAGKLPEAKKAAETFAAAAKDDRERALANADQADVLRLMGDLAKARGAAERAVAIGRKAVAASPSDAAQENASIRSLMGYGEIQRIQGDLVGAQKTYQEAADRAHKSLTADPTDALARDRVAAVMLHVTDVLLARGKAAEARQAAEEDLTMERSLIRDAPDSIVYQRHAVVALIWLSDIYSSLGAFEEARRANEEIVATASKLLAADPANASAQRDLVYGLAKTAALLRIEGNFDGSLQTSNRALQLSRDQAKSPSAAMDVRQDVGTWLMVIADTRLLKHDVAGSRQAVDEAVTILRGLGPADPTNATTKRFLAAALYSQGAALTQVADYPAASAAFDEGLKIDRALLEVNGDDEQVESDFADGHLGEGRLLLAQGKSSAAMESLQNSLRIRRRLAAAQFGSSASERAVAEVMRVLVEVPGSGVTWNEFSKQVQAMDDKKILWPADRVWLQEARQHSSGGTGP